MIVRSKSGVRGEGGALTAERRAACGRVVAIVAAARGVEARALFRRTRSELRIAAARQLAMYLCHTLLGLSMTEVGRYFGRDRTTVAHACALIEDSRDDRRIDVDIEMLENRIMGFTAGLAAFASRAGLEVSHAGRH